MQKRVLDKSMKNYLNKLIIIFLKVEKNRFRRKILLFVTKNFCKISGYKEELIGKNIIFKTSRCFQINFLRNFGVICKIKKDLGWEIKNQDKYGNSGLDKAISLNMISINK